MSSESTPRISVLIPAYNHENYVEQTLRSFAEQDYPDIELIVVNDGSKDGTHEKIEAVLAEIRADFSAVNYVNQQNQGVIRTLSKALSLATGEFVYLGASDDYLHAHNALTILSQAMCADEQVGLVWGDAVIVDGQSQRVGWDAKQNNLPLEQADYQTTHPFFTNGRNLPEEALGSYESLIKGNYLSNALLVRKRCLIEAGGYEKSYGLEDLAMWISLAKRYKLQFVDQPLGAYRWHDENTVKSLPPQVMIDFYTFLLGEKEFCKSQGLLGAWLRTSRSGYKALCRSGASKQEKQAGLTGLERFLLGSRQALSLYEACVGFGKKKAK